MAPTPPLAKTYPASDSFGDGLVLLPALERGVLVDRKSLVESSRLARYKHRLARGHVVVMVLLMMVLAGLLGMYPRPLARHQVADRETDSLGRRCPVCSDAFCRAVAVGAFQVVVGAKAAGRL